MLPVRPCHVQQPLPVGTDLWFPRILFSANKQLWIRTGGSLLEDVERAVSIREKKNLFPAVGPTARPIRPRIKREACLGFQVSSIRVQLGHIDVTLSVASGCDDSLAVGRDAD